MSSPTLTDICQSLAAHVVLEWDETSPNGQERHFLTAPDPSDAKIIFKSDISATSSNGDGDAIGSAVGVFMRLHIPVKLKQVPARTPIHIHIRPSHVQSCSFAVAVDAPEAIRAVSQGQLASLSMKLGGPVQVVVPHNMAYSSRPAKSRASGRVLDAIRSLSRATQLVMYMPANLAPRTHLHRLSALLTGGGGGGVSVQELPPYIELFKLFGGSGGRIWDVEPSYSAASPPDDDGGGDRDVPPPYQEVSTGPSAASTLGTQSEGRDGKRRRSSNDELASTKRPDLRASPPRSHLPEKAQGPEPTVLQRLALLEAVVHAQAVQISNLSSENQAQRKRIDECEAELAALRLETGRVDRLVDRLDLEVSEQREDIARLDGSVQYCLEREDDITEAVMDAVTERISERGLSAANIHFTLGDG
ncbi:hypothetical protein N658DRAFT_515624 [Parathielavia hyrcaniae]|uniref:Uncharacterized protein n=1 Tax=Parathielavia hyrcaniae TaxID=113614 RepID=A0AAN6Q1S4_9PEZI|nr:hypothetical protein N658DRAFT_515624 [Parathielavia hyrcaniae]